MSGTETVDQLHRRLQREKRTYAPSEMIGRARKLERILHSLIPAAQRGDDHARGPAESEEFKAVLKEALSVTNPTPSEKP